MRLQQQLEGHRGQTLCVQFDAGGRRLATGARDNTLAIWSSGKSRPTREFDNESTLTALGLTPDGGLISGDLVGRVCVWNWKRKSPEREFCEFSRPVYTLGCSPDGSLIAAGSGDDRVAVWELDSGRLVHLLEVGHRGMSFVFSAGGEHLVTGHGGDTLRFWSLQSGEVDFEQVCGPGTVGGLALDHSGQWVVSRAPSGPITIWSASSWEYSAVLPIVERGITGAKLRPGHDQLACIWGNRVGMFDARTGRQLDEATLPQRGVYDLDFSPDGARLATASSDGIARIWALD